MSQNVAKNRKWIAETYKKSTVRDKCQEWVDANTDKKTAKEIEAGLLSVFNSVTDEELSKISKHLSGDAFDVQPVDKDADAIKKTLRGLSGLDKFLDTEGGLVRWHAQF
jgi:c-di-GMP-related signal transduction protein